MATQKPISTISYNSPAFLKEKLDTWVSAHIIQAYQFICHKGEDGDKDHIHLRVEPNKRIDQMDLQEQLREYVFGSDKPLGVRPFRPSKEEDWFLYAVHDPTYLKLKYGGGEKGEKLPYLWQDIVASDFYDVEVAFVRAKAYLEHTSVNMATRLQQGTNALDLILEGENVYTVGALIKALNMTDYERLSAEFEKLRFSFSSLLAALQDIGYTAVFDQDGSVTLLRND